eukprot:1159810-Pelagomonas_calceolata.AAC.13
MGICRVVAHAPGRPDSRSPPPHPQNSSPRSPMKMKSIFQSGKGVAVSAELEFNKVDVPVSRRDLNRIKVQGLLCPDPGVSQFGRHPYQ